MTRMKRWLLLYLHSGESELIDSEDKRRILVVNLFCLIGLSITGIMSVVALINHRPVLAACLAISAAVFCLSHLLVRHGVNHRLSAVIVLYNLYCLMIYLVANGGVAQTGPLWIFLVAPVTFSLHGLKRGSVDLLLFMLVVCVILYTPNHSWVASYPETFKSRLLLSFMTLTFLTGFYEYSRQEMFDHLQQMSDRFQSLSKLDPLTQLANRREALSILRHEQLRSRRSGEPLSVVLCDVDHFKSINDNYGHEAGDAVLVDLANFFNDFAREQDLISRWGGEEFLMVLPQTSAAQACHFAEKIRRFIADEVFRYRKGEFDVTVSLGVAEVDPQADVQQAIHQADVQLYCAKDGGRNQTQPQNLLHSDTDAACGGVDRYSKDEVTEKA
jgi:diguanylate cyclase (GGDEF)-like protein